MKCFFRAETLVLSALFWGVLALSGCDQPGANANLNANRPTNANMTNANLSSMNANSVGMANANSMNSSTAAIETREPETYQATVTLKLETMGAQKQPAALPPIAAQVARNGADRRMEFALPNGEKVIYLDAGGKHYLISPNRKQFAELNQDSLGFEVRNLMTPAQIVNQVQNLKGVERVGEETMNGRTVTKYRYAGTTKTNSQAGNVDTESFILVDKDTGLPLRSETNSQSEGGQVNGVSGLRLLTEMSNINTTVTPDLFTPPSDYKQVSADEIRTQVNAIFNVAIALLGNVIKNSQPQPQSANSPMMSPTP